MLDYDQNFSLSDQLFDVDAWRRLGRSVRYNNIVEKFALWTRFDHLEFPAAQQCIDAFIKEVKHHMSVKHASLKLKAASIDDLGEFIQNNKGLEHLTLEDGQLVSLEQSTVLSKAIGSVHLEELDMSNFRFENTGSFEQMLGGFASVKRLEVLCTRPSECTAVAGLLRDTSNVLTRLHVTLNSGWSKYLSRSEIDQAIREFSASGRKHSIRKPMD